jgi:hypothetical protein
VPHRHDLSELGALFGNIGAPCAHVFRLVVVLLLAVDLHPVARAGRRRQGETTTPSPLAAAVPPWEHPLMIDAQAGRLQSLLPRAEAASGVVQTT